MSTRLRGSLCLAVAMAALLIASPARPGDAESSDSILDRVDELQKIAREANGGARGCGVGKLTIKHGATIVEVTSGLDPIHVFGNPVDVADLKTILESRVAAQTDESSPLRGDFDDLCYVCLHTIQHVPDPEAVPILHALTRDDSDTVRSWAVLALLHMESKHAGLRGAIRALELPKRALDGARGRGATVPDWVSVEKEAATPGAKRGG